MMVPLCALGQVWHPSLSSPSSSPAAPYGTSHEARGHLRASLGPRASWCGEGEGMEDIHRERQGCGGCQGAGPEGDRRVPAGGGRPRRSPSSSPHPHAWAAHPGGGGASSHTALPDPAAHMYLAPHTPGPARGLRGPHCDGCPLLQVVRSYKATIQQTLDILFLREGSEFLSSTDASSRDSADRTIIAWDFQSSAKISNQIFHVRNPVIGHCFQIEPQPQGASV